MAMLMANDHSLGLLLVKLSQQKNELEAVVSNGGCHDYSEYKNLCGKIEGLALAERELLDLDERLKHE